MARRKLSHRVGPLLARVLGPPVVRALARSWTVRLDPPDLRERVRSGSPAVYAFWHGKLMVPVLAFRDGGGAVMISRHADGESLSRVAASLGYLPVRGSTTRGGAAALHEFVDKLRAGRSGGLTPDGPRGPAKVAQSGAIFAASRAGVPLVPLGVAVRGAWALRSWDAFRIPRPFTTVAVVAEDPLLPPPDVEGATLEAFCRRLEASLATADRRAEGLLGPP